MSELTPVTKCPKCAGTTIEFAAFTKADLNDMLTCPACGHRARKSEFIADAVGEGIKLIKEGLRDLPGFKPK